ncbi:MAG: Amino acid permease-associated region [Pseudonocardia sp.]|nr:Amino acid permease-associated region [Pseudonocardia sp.]
MADNVAEKGTHPGAEQPELRRAIGPGLLLFFVIGDILGTGIYALTGSVAGEIGGALWLPFLLAFVVAYFTAFSYLELVGKYPRAAGARSTRTRPSGSTSSPSW